MKHWLVFALTCWMQQLSAQEIRVGLFAYPPEVMIADENAEQRFSGRSVTLIRRAIEASGHRVLFIELPFRRAYSELKNNRIDLLFPATAPDTDIITLQPALKNSVPGLCFRRPANIEHLYDKTVLNGLKIAYPAGASIEPLSGEPVVLVKLYGNNMNIRGLNMVLKKRVDALYHENPDVIDPHWKTQVQCLKFDRYIASVYLAASADFSWRHSLLFYQLQHHLAKLLHP